MILSAADPSRAAKELVTANPRWAIRALSTCAMSVSPDSLTCVRIWQLFFAAFFTKATNVSAGSKLFFAPTFMKIAFTASKTGSRVDKMRERLIGLVEYFRLRSPALADLYKCMCGWLVLDTDRFTADTMFVIDPVLQPHLVSSLLDFGGETDEIWKNFDDPAIAGKFFDGAANGWKQFEQQQLDQIAAAVSNKPERPKSPLPPSAAPAAPPALQAPLVSPKNTPTLHLRNVNRRQNRQSTQIQQFELDLQPPPFSSKLPRIQPLQLEENAQLITQIIQEAETVAELGKEFGQVYDTSCHLSGLFTTVIPQTHHNLKQVIRRELRCNKPKTGCSGAAQFVATIEVAQEQHSAILASKNYLSQIGSLFGVRPELVPSGASAAALKLEKTLVALVKFADKNLKSGTADAVAREAFFELLQRHLVFAARFPPTKIAIENSVRLLAPPFVANHPQSMKQLLLSMTSGDQRASLLVPFFNPNLAPAEFVAMFKVLSQAIASIGETHFAAAVKRFDVAKWLADDAGAKKEEQQDLFKILVGILNHTATTSPNVFSVVAEEALRHMSELVAWKFPLHLNRTQIGVSLDFASCSC